MIINYISIIMIIIGIFLTIIALFHSKNWNRTPKNIIKEPTYAILIPARDESKVIENLLKSIKNQTKKINMTDVYIIVENPLDKTVEIAKSYNSSIIIRKNLHLKRKGYALDEAIKHILKENKHYDMYFIIDADNILDKNFIQEMLTSYHQGYDITISYRNGKNSNENVISGASTLTFSLMNTLLNRSRNKQKGNCAVSGTGFYIKGEFIEKWQCFPFHSLTEDYELTLYSIANNMTSHYNEKAIFYDEQPIKLKQSITQRTRWIKGFLEARKKYIPIFNEKYKQNKKENKYLLGDILGIIPYLFLIFGIILLFLNNLIIGIITLFKDQTISLPLLISLLIIIIIYLILIAITIYILKLDTKLNINKKMKIKLIFFHPIFLLTYVNCFLKAITKKDITWDKIEHQSNSIN